MNKYVRFVSGMHRYFRDRISTQEALERARTLLTKRIADRNQNFLNLLQKGVYEYPKSPYLQILNARKIAHADIKGWVEREGIEHALGMLLNDGVYFTVDEFKGKRKFERSGGISFTCKEGMFDNPFLATAYEVRSGASRSAGTRVRIDFDYLRQRSLYDAILLNSHGVLNAPLANWFPLFPGAPGINSSLRFSYIGNPPKKWFSQVDKAQVKVNWEKRFGTELIFLMARLHGIPLARPEYASLNYAFKIAEWVSQCLKEHGACVVYTFATSAVRICMAASENNLSVKDTVFLVTGEPLTAQRRKEIEEAGARVVPVYGISEAGVIAAGGMHPYPESDHCYLYKDTTAIITHEYDVPHSGIKVNSFLFSTILYESPKLLLNVGMGDYGDVYVKQDNSEFGKLGFDTHVSNIRSYEKLTGEGVTFVDTDFIAIIEKRLPEKFGGTSTDYQLIEEEDEKGLNRLQLVIHPRLGPLEEKVVVDAFIGMLKTSEDSPESWAQSGTEMWHQARTVRLRREPPIPTRAGKILPFHIVQPKQLTPE